MNSLGRQMSVVTFFLFRLWSTPDLLHGKIQFVTTLSATLTFLMVMFRTTSKRLTALRVEMFFIKAYSVNLLIYLFLYLFIFLFIYLFIQLSDVENSVLKRKSFLN